MEIKNLTVSVRKNITGTVAFELEDFYGEKQARTFIFTQARPELSIPYNYALSIFNGIGTLGFYTKGIITITKGKEELFEIIEEEQIADAEYLSGIEIPSDEEIMTVLNRANEAEIIDLLERFEDKVFDLAVANAPLLSSRAINTIEQITKIALVYGE